jgi:hypothetical protein
MELCDLCDDIRVAKILTNIWKILIDLVICHSVQKASPFFNSLLRMIYSFEVLWKAVYFRYCQRKEYFDQSISDK